MITLWGELPASPGVVDRLTVVGDRLFIERMVVDVPGLGGGTAGKRCLTPRRTWPFKFLHQKAREEGRRDKKRGVEVARLALDSLDGNEDRLGPRVHELQVEGWSWFANAQRLDLDFRAAETSFRRAEGEKMGPLPTTTDDLIFIRLSFRVN